MIDGFKTVPGFSRYVINREGVLIDTHTGKTKTWYIQKPIAVMGGRNRNLKRGYRIARVIDHEGNKRHIFQHRIIATLFVPCQGNPDDFIVNHKDGDGGNNEPGNLEWVTYSENMIHAYQTGLCKNVRTVQVRNYTTGVIREFNSIADCAREFDLPHPTLRNRLVNNAGKVYDDGLAFKYADDPSEWSDVQIRSVKPKAVCALDVVDNKFFVASNQKELGAITGLSEGNINAILRKESMLPLGRFVVMWMKASDMMVPEYTPVQLDLLKLPRTRADQGGWLEIDNETGLSGVYLTAGLAEKHGYSVSQMQSIAKKGISPCGRFKFEYISPIAANYSPLTQ